MKTIIKKVGAILPEIEQEIEKRESYFDSRSEAWHDSDASTDYEEKTDALRELSEAISDFLSNFS